MVGKQAIRSVHPSNQARGIYAPSGPSDRCIIDVIDVSADKSDIIF